MIQKIVKDTKTAKGRKKIENWKIFFVRENFNHFSNITYN
jgi:hypothetical protein